MKVSIIIPTHNRVNSLITALNSLKDQVIGLPYEIIVVVDGCEDETEKLLNADFPEIKLVVYKKNVGAAIGLNGGAKIATGDILLFLDDDMEYQPMLVQSHIEMHKGGKYDVLIGNFPLGHLPTDSYFRNVIFDWTEGWQETFSENVSFYNSLCSGHFSIKRALFEKVGMFDENFSRWGRKDSELGYRLIKAGAIFGYCRNAKAFQNYDKSPTGFLEDFRFLGRADVEMFIKHPELKRTLLLSSFFQAPWLVQFLRVFAVRNKSFARMTLSMAAKAFDFIHLTGFKSKFVESIYWITADCFYWNGALKALGNAWQLKNLIGNSVPILMYHRISNKSDPFCVSPDCFNEQMAFLKENGYRVLTLDTVINSFKNQKILPPKSVAITFDDGSIDFLEAFEILKLHDFPVTLFVTGSYADDNTTMDARDQLYPYLSKQQIKELATQGVSIQAHGYRHIKLGKVDQKEAEADVAAIKKWLNELGIAPQYFAYPSGSFNEHTKTILKKLGYQAGLTSISNLSSFDVELFEIPRINIEEGNIEDFKFRLKYGIGLSYAQDELLGHLGNFHPTKWWHSAPDFDENKIYVYQTKAPLTKEK